MYHDFKAAVDWNDPDHDCRCEALGHKAVCYHVAFTYKIRGKSDVIEDALWLSASICEEIEAGREDIEDLYSDCRNL